MDCTDFITNCEEEGKVSMIVMRLRGRLGNQLFIYAFGRALQTKYNMPLILVDNENDTGGSKIAELKIPSDIIISKYSVGYKFDYYNMKAEDYKKVNTGLSASWEREQAYNNFCKENGIPLMNLSQKVAIYKHKILTRRCSLTERYKKEKEDAISLARRGIFVCENGYIDFEEPFSNIKNIFGFGYFQSEKYFENIKDEIRKEVRRKDELRPELQEYVDGIENSNSVCLSIRMGDYLNNPVLGVCTQKYYEKAIEKIYDLYPDARIYVYSDDIDAVMKMFHFKNDVVVEPHGCSESEKLTYMSKCKHFIVSNSSFSWWAQYLGEYEGKTVIAPNKWTKVSCPCDIYQKGWIIIEV